ncbi:MAG: hypothetical protein NZM29_02235 [Nitrospira sp.]|nr:hypothetical protein [Nitrospira sp.]MDW8258918.1 hypothetical protein [Gammaproteobacteria bacterium]
MIQILIRRVSRLAMIGVAAAVCAQTSNPALQGTRPVQSDLGELTMPVQELRISKLPPAGIALLAGLPECLRDRAPGSMRLGSYPAAPGGACLESAGATTDGRIPPQEWEVETVGGTNPVSITVATPQTPQLSSLFTVLPGGSDSLPLQRVDSARESFEAARNQVQPAGRRIWRVRFAGMPYDPNTTPSEIVVVLNARDGNGSVKGGDFRLFPYSPRIVSATSANAVPRKPAVLTVLLAGLGKASEVSFLSHANVIGHCAWNEVGQMPEIGESTIKVDETPRAIGPSGPIRQFTRSGVFFAGFTSGATVSQTCRPKLKIRLRFDRSTVTEPAIILSAPNTVQLGARILYTISETGVLREKLGLFGTVNIKQKPNMGICSGNSIGPAGTFPVGRHHVQGDLSFRIRSGPIGTDCEYTDIRTATDPVILPPGILLHDSKWSISGGSSKCRVVSETEGDSAFVRRPWTEAPNELRSVSGLDRVLMDPENPGVVIHEAPSDGFRTVLRSVVVRLQCDATASNDHEVRATLESVVFSGPEGWAGF